MLAPTIAEQARTTLASTPTATLAALDIDGRPLLCPVRIVDDGSGAPVTVLSNLSPLVSRSRQDARAGMSIGDRLTLQGDLAAVPGLQQLAMQPALAERHPNLAGPMESIDYSWIRLVPSRVQWTDERGIVHALAPSDLANAEPDPLAPTQADLVAEIAERLDDDLLLLAQGLVGRWRATAARLTSVDRYGLVVEVDEPVGTCTIRVPFPQRLSAVGEIHAAVAALRNAANETPTGRARRGVVGLPLAEPDRVAAEPAREDTQRFDGWVPPADGPGAGTRADEPEPETGPDVEFVVLPAHRGVEFDWDGLAATASLGEGVEGDRRGRSDVDGVDPPRHRNSYSLMDSLERAGREARALAAEEEPDSLVGTDLEVGDVDRVVTGRQGDQADAGVDEDVETGGERVEACVGEGVGLTHRDPPGSPVQRVAARRVEEVAVDPESGCAPQDDAHVGGIHDALAHQDVPG